MADRRKHKRKHMIYYSKVFDENTDNVTGRLVNLSAEGMMLINEKPIESDKSFRFRMVLPDEIEGKIIITLDMTSRWSRGDMNSDYYDTGFQLRNRNRKNTEIVKRLMKDYSFNY